MNVTNMSRVKTSFRLDERVLEAIAQASAASGHSRNAWLEIHLFNLFKGTGLIEQQEQPLGEQRGGDRTAQKQKAM
jgi:hypothetical protein